MKKQIKEYIRAKNEKLRAKLLVAAVTGSKEKTREVMEEVLGVVSAVFGEVPQVLGPVYALALEALLPGLTPGDDDKKYLAALKKVYGVSCVTVRSKDIGKGGDNGEG